MSIIACGRACTRLSVCARPNVCELVFWHRLRMYVRACVFCVYIVRLRARARACVCVGVGGVACVFVYLLV